MTTRPNVKSDDSPTTDSHENDKNFLTFAEVQQLLAATKSGRHATRDKLILLMIYRHGLRVSELINMRTEQIDLASARVWVKRIKRGLSVHQPIESDALRAIKRYLRSRSDNQPWLFVNERQQPFTRQGINYLVSKYAKSAALENIHPHTLRHSCGYYLADKGCELRLIQDYLGHRDIRHTVKYTRIAGSRFNGLWN